MEETRNKFFGLKKCNRTRDTFYRPKTILCIAGNLKKCSSAIFQIIINQLEQTNGKKKNPANRMIFNSQIN